MIKTGFSTAAHSLWAKKSKSEDLWLPLYTHMQDAAETARRLWGYWLPGGTKNRIMSSIIPVERQNDEFARKICVFLAAAHDLGKASPVFQSKKSGLSISLDEILHGSIRDAGLVLEDNRRYSERSATHHSIVSHEILRRYDIDESVAVVLGAHHGKPPSNSQLERLKSYEKNCGFGDESWKNVQAELFCHALAFAGLGKNDIVCLKLKKPAQVLLSGVIIIADWIASDESRFPLIDIEESWSDSEARAKSAWDNLGLTLCWETENNWEDLYGRRFGIKTPRPVQETLLDVIQKCLNPGIVVVEAPMGEGKTEAALSAAEVMAYFAGRGGVFFALPTQATSDAMFSRVLSWIGRIDEHGTDRHSVLLAHGKADFNEGYRKIRLSGNTNVGNWEDDDDDGDGYGENVVVHEWFSGRKKGILADFVIGTIDQLLMAGLKQKHVMLRHLGLANKVVIIDECHAYDVYMSQYLEKTLNWLGVYGVPVIVLSATLPAERRKQVIDAYLNKDSTPVQRAVPWKGIKEQKTPRPEWVESREYPLITYTDNGEVKQVVVMGEKRHLTVHVNLQSDDDILEMLNDLLADGGCAGIIVNTVNRAQAIYEIMVERFGEERVKLLHARFIATDRAEREKDLMELLGPDDAIRPDKLIVIGTQVLEQSLDLDFDV
ncbi:MAG: CRISPR-associated helicase Cas3', partial [Synergistaceae bacterium]|nr:CRISPR-associated helicase Cas3' [Synergistaceae bacterium]